MKTTVRYILLRQTTGLRIQHWPDRGYDLRCFDRRWIARDAGNDTLNKYSVIGTADCGVGIFCTSNARLFDRHKFGVDATQSEFVK